MFFFNSLRNTLVLSLLLLTVTSLAQSVVIEDAEYANIADHTSAIFSTNFDADCPAINLDINYALGLNLRVENLKIFNRGDSSFPLERGVVFSMGNAETVVGPNNTLDASTGLNQFGTYVPITELLDKRIGNTGQYFESKAIRLSVQSSATVFNLRYIFASEAYQNGTIECFNGDNMFQDGFAIIIKGPGIIKDTYDHDNDAQTPEITFSHGGKNIALLPDGTTEVGLHSVHQNPNCSNEGFSQYYEEIPLGSGAISLNGMTVPLTATSPIIPGELYEIEIMMTSRGDTNLDSVLFIEFPVYSKTPNFEDAYMICLVENGNSTGPQVIIDTQINDSNYSFQWFLNGSLIENETNSAIITQLPGQYKVEVFNPSGCSNSYSTSVAASSAPFNLSYEVTGNLFSNVKNVMLFAEGSGDYLFQLNDSSLQTSPIFENIAAGDYFARVVDSNGCGFSEIAVTVDVFKYPKFFTPNGDGINDTWTIKLSELGRSGTIEIYNRYGKLLKTINSEGIGWDGTLHGTRLPTDDYWFILTFSNNETFTGHFTLKR